MQRPSKNAGGHTSKFTQAVSEAASKFKKRTMPRKKDAKKEESKDKKKKQAVKKKRQTRDKKENTQREIDQNYETALKSYVEMEGGFGDVYKAKKVGADLFVAIKTELNEFNGKKLDHLKVEVCILETINEMKDERRRKHFVKLLDKGKTDIIKLIVMQLLGPNIDDLRRQIICNDFSPSSAIRICQQSLQAIWDLHTIGFIHKDIKPQNFAIGLGDDCETLYIIDLGIAHRYRDKRTNKLKPARSKVRFMGTVRYASRNCHRCKDQSRKDDLETWIYMCAELFASNILPWKRVVDRNRVLQEKEKFFSSPDPHIFNRIPSGFENVMKYVDQLKFEDEPNYMLLQLTLDQIIKDDRININAPYDWTKKVTMGKGIDYRAKEQIESRDVSMIKDEDAEMKTDKHDMKDSFEAVMESSHLSTSKFKEISLVPCKKKSGETKSVYLFPGGAL